ncbi:hypothetical protein B0T18DRAFT_331380 [Schizothecium vesticola]|uniref:PNPLA domain-containing protein n=1 Tax=Schizothecium vesticola TaxID=314040 RepID=A0AA40EL86_9PEZI|nr:hypothetical protein B0T18DRAFT_331380 [Schizothecium vesticola]
MPRASSSPTVPEAEIPLDCSGCGETGWNFRAPFLRQCAGCLPSEWYHITSTQEDEEPCWVQHKQAALPRQREKHVEVNPMFQFLVDSVMSEKDQRKFELSQSLERFARWFSVTRSQSPNSPSGEEAHLWLYDRFNRLCGSNSTGNGDAQNHFPTFVSFIGSTSAGKSTILRAILLLGLLDSVNFSDTAAVVDLVNEAREGRKQMPVPRSTNINDISSPTTFGVHLYRDEGLSLTRPLRHRRTRSGLSHGQQQQTPKYPLLFADCEGFDASVARPRGSALPSLNEDDNANLRKLPITAECYGQRGQQGVDLFYARVMYAISDVIVYVTKDDNLMNSMQKILEWAASAVDKSYNQPARKTLIIVKNKEQDLSQNGVRITGEALEKLYLHQHQDVLWNNSLVLREFVRKHNDHVKAEHRIEDNRKLYSVLFHQIHCCYIPDRGEEAAISPERAKLVYQHFEDLRHRIQKAAEEEQGLRAMSFAEYNVPAMTRILSEVFDHFRQNEGPLDFWLATRGDNPTPQNMSEHIANFLRMTLGQIQDGNDRVDQHIITAVALGFLVRVMRSRNGELRNPRDMFDRDMLPYWSDAMDMYLLKYDRCLHRWFPGRGVDQVLCAVRGRAQHKMHIGDSANQVQAGEFSGKFWGEAETKSWISSIRKRFVNMCHEVFPVHESRDDPDRLLNRLRYATQAEVRATLGRMRSNKTCFACLQAVPDHVLPCGHALCPTCIQEMAKPSRFVECAFDVPSCVLCGKHNIHQVQLKPKCAGVRILSLDGGGVRGIVELAVLSRIQKEVGIEVNIKELFDLVVGTSTGGIIALGIVMKNEPVEAMIKFFEEAAEATFSKPNSGLSWTAKLGMTVLKYSSIYPETNLKQQLQNFFGTTPLFAPATSGTFQSTTRVAVTTYKDGLDGAGIQSLIANYNRPGGDWAYFDREDDASMDMAIWEAALATSAAPGFLPAYTKASMNYVDGALYANCPVRVALEEKDRIWRHDGASLDLLVSLGAGQQEKKFRAPRLLNYTFFRSIIKSYEGQMNTTFNWEKIESVSSPLAKRRLFRLNPSVRSRSGGYVELDDYQDMEFLRTGIQSGTLLQREDEVEAIPRVARTLLANLFFFEPYDQNPRPGALYGSIRCRLPHETDALSTLLRDKVVGFYSVSVTREEAAAVESIPNGRWEQLHGVSVHAKPVDMMHEEIFEDGSSIKKFRLDCTVGSETEARPYCILAVRLAEIHETFPISGFPATLIELKERWGARWV